MAPFFFDGVTITSLEGAKIRVMSTAELLYGFKEKKLTHASKSKLATALLTGELGYGLCAILPDTSVLVLWCTETQDACGIMLQRLWTLMSRAPTVDERYRYALDCTDLEKLAAW